DEGLGRKLSAHLGGLVPRRLGLTVHWVVPEAVVPRAVGELLVMDGGPAGPLWVQGFPPRPAGTPGEEGGLRPGTAAPPGEAGVRDAGEAGLKLATAGLERALEALMPFAAEQRLARSVPLVDGPGARAGAGPHVVYAAPEGTPTGIEGLGVRTPGKHILYAGREAVTGIGLEGELLAGARAAAVVHEAVRRRDPLKKRRI